MAMFGQDPCILNQPCPICDNFTELQKEAFTPSYCITKVKILGTLVSPKDVTIIASVEDKELIFQFSVGMSVQPSEHHLIKLTTLLHM